MALNDQPVVRVRPLKQFRVVVAYGPYRVGDIIQPTGMYRSVLLARQIIVPVEDPPRGMKAVDDVHDLGVDDEPELADRMVAPQFRKAGRRTK